MLDTYWYSTVHLKNNREHTYVVLFFDRGPEAMRNSHLSLSPSIRYNSLTLLVEGTVCLRNTIIGIHNASHPWNIFVMADSAYAFNNVTFVCFNESYICNVSVTISSYYIQSINFVNVTCIDNSENGIDMCNSNNSITNADKETKTRIELLTQLIDEFEFEYSQQCSNTSNNTMYFDFGYPLYGDLAISNNNEGSSICCRGSESCAYSKRIYSNLGNIFCTGDFSCGLSQSIWTSDFVDIIGMYVCHLSFL